MTTALLAAYAFLVAAPPATPIPNCGVVATYVYLANHGKEVPLSDIQAAFSADSSESPGAVSVAQICDVLASFEQRSLAASYTAEALATLPLPAILHISAGKWPDLTTSTTGHFVTLTRREGNAAILLDWSGRRVNPEVRMPLSDLAQRWDGVAITSPISRRLHVGVICTLAATALAALWFGLRRKNYTTTSTPVHTTPLLSAPLLLLLTGCEQSPVTPASEPTATPIIFDAPVYDAGTVPPDKSVTHTFTFHTWPDGPVTILGFESSCGCTTPDKSLIGKELAPNTEHALRVVVTPNTEGVPVTHFVRCKLHSSHTPLPTVAVTYLRGSAPRISPARITMTATQSAAPTPLKITYRHPVGTPPRPVTVSECKGTHFRVTDSEEQSETVLLDENTGSHIQIDTTVLTLTPTAPSGFGTHKGIFRVAFADGSEKIIDTVLERAHPHSFQSSRIFLGHVSPDAAWSRTLRFKTTHTAPPALTATDDSRSVAATTASSNTITLRGRTPTISGRFETQVTVTFEDGVPPLVLPVSGIVQGIE